MPQLPCTFIGCVSTFRSQQGRTRHFRTFHENHNMLEEVDYQANVPHAAGANEEGGGFFMDAEDVHEPPEGGALPFIAPRTPSLVEHPFLTGTYHVIQSRNKRSLKCFLGSPCDIDGTNLPPQTPPPPRDLDPAWAPFETEQQFRVADFLYRKAEMSAGNIDTLLEIWGLTMAQNEDLGPFTNYEQMYGAIDSISFGDAPWKCFSAGYQGEKGPNHPSWQDAEYDVWYRDPATVIKQLFDNPDFDKQFDYAPYVGLNKAGKQKWSDFMSGNFAWRHSVSGVVSGSVNRHG